MSCPSSALSQGRYHAIEALVAAAFAVPLGEVRAKSRRKAQTALARQSTMYLTHIVFGVSFTAIGSFAGRDRTTVAHACRRIEEMRENPRMDRVLSRLEDVIGRLGRPQVVQ